MAPKTKPEVPERYKNFVSVDPETGAPSDYDSLAIAYRKLAFLCAQQAGIFAPQDQEDAVQSVLFRFWKNDGLSKYDGEKLWATQGGQLRRAKFNSMFRSFVGLSMMAERDRVISASGKGVLSGTSTDLANIEQVTLCPPIADPSEEVAEQDAAVRWLQRAATALKEQSRPDLIPVLLLCAERAKDGGMVTRADIVAVTGVRLRAATALLGELQDALKNAEMGPESLTNEL